MKPISRSLAGLLSALVGALIVFAIFHFTVWGKGAAAPPNISVSDTPINRDAKLGLSFAPVVKKAAPSVVNIYSTRIIKERPTINPFMNDPLFRQFFGNQFPENGQPLTQREQSLGSGVIVSPNGYILTANHVVQGADEIKVAIAGNDKKYPAKVIGTDPKTDVAVLKIDEKNLPAITLGDSSQLEIGDVVLAIGNPFGMGQTVTMGIVSALGRHYKEINGYQNFIQTDAAINPGNSGGALVDAEGRLVGINTWIATSSGGNEGVGFAVPINMARYVMDQLISSGKVTRGYLGIGLQDVTPDLAEEFNLSSDKGALVNDVLTNTPAEKAGIQSGDVIIAFNDKPIADANSLQLAVSDCAPGSRATIKVIRDGREKTFTVKLGDLPGEKGETAKNQTSSTSNTTDALNGVTVDDLNPNARQELKIPDDIQGAIVTDVDPDSNAADAGLEKNDVIMEIDRHPVKNADDAVTLAEQAKGKRILLKIWHGNGEMGGTYFLTVDNTKRKQE
ncbi:MAG: DegQ family serine endoprotease [Limisphaerales bacterium]